MGFKRVERRVAIMKPPANKKLLGKANTPLMRMKIRKVIQNRIEKRKAFLGEVDG